MRRLLYVTIVSTVTTLAGCGSNTNPPPASPPPSGGGDTITGRERIGWIQTADSASDLSLYRYALYVDGVRRVIEGEACSSTAPTTLECSAPLPTLTAGTHTLELAGFIPNGDSVVEGGRSTPLRVTVAGLTAPAASGQVQGGIVTSSDGLRLQADIILRDLSDPVDLAVTRDGQVFVAERAGRVRVIDPRAPDSSARVDDALRLPAEDAGETRLASLALSPDFAQARGVFVAYLADDRDGPVLRIARFRESLGVLGQAAVIASHPVAPEASVVTRFGPDGALYVGVGTGTQPDGAQNLASASGKILRLREDGTAAKDNPWSSPVFSAGHRDPRGLVWHPADGSLWEVERDEEGDELNVIRAGANYGWPLATGVRSLPRLTPATQLLPPGTEPSGATTVTVPTSPLFGDLIVAALSGEDLLRVRVGTGRQRRTTGRLLQGRFGRIGQVAASSDGGLYLITANGQTWGEGHDMLIRLAIADR